MSSNWNPVNHVFHMISRLIYAEKGKTIENARMDLFAAVCYYADHYLTLPLETSQRSMEYTHLFPGIGAPGLRTLSRTKMYNIAHYSV